MNSSEMPQWAIETNQLAYDRVVKSYVHNMRGLHGPKVALHEFAGARQLKKTAPQRSPKSFQHLVPEAQWTDSLNNMLLSQKSWASPRVRGQCDAAHTLNYLCGMSGSYGLDDVNLVWDCGSPSRPAEEHSVL